MRPARRFSWRASPGSGSAVCAQVVVEVEGRVVHPDPVAEERDALEALAEARRCRAGRARRARGCARSRGRPRACGARRPRRSPPRPRACGRSAIRSRGTWRRARRGARSERTPSQTLPSSRGRSKLRRCTPRAAAPEPLSEQAAVRGLAERPRARSACPAAVSEGRRAPPAEPAPRGRKGQPGHGAASRRAAAAPGMRHPRLGNTEGWQNVRESDPPRVGSRGPTSSG